MPLSGKNALEKAFVEKRLHRPSVDGGGLVDLARAVGLFCRGQRGNETGKELELYDEIISGVRHLVLVVVDGLGDEQLRRDLPHGFFSSCRYRCIDTVFPSSTAPAMTSLATGLYPASHAVPGWWIYEPSRKLTIEALPFVERFTRKALDYETPLAEKIFSAPALADGYVVDCLTVTCREYVDSVYSIYTRAGGPGAGYDGLSEGAALVREHVEACEVAGRRSYTFWYIPAYDSCCHANGVLSKAARKALREIETVTDELAQALPRRCRLLVTGDHGHVDVDDSMYFELFDEDEIMSCLEIPPFGELSSPFFKVREERFDEFPDRFERRWGRYFALLTPDEVEDLELMGPAGIAPATRRRMGDFVAVPVGGPCVFHYRAARGDSFRFAGIHGGLSRSETVVPLVVAGD